MKIGNLRSERDSGRVRAAATITWEDRDLPDKEVYVAVDEAFGCSLACNPHTFLVAALIPAMHCGEERVLVDAEICPELRQGLCIAMRTFETWYKGGRWRHKPIQIEARTLRQGRTKASPEREAFLISGGIDSLATLRANRLNYPPDHPRALRDGFILGGLQPEVDAVFEDVVRSLSVIADAAHFTLIPVFTNVRDLVDDWSFWAYYFEGACFAAVAHAFAPRITALTIASSCDLPNLQPFGSHPLIDPNYSSSDLRIRHDDITLSRFDKTKLLAEWDVALQRLRVCNSPQPGSLLNCGQCEKCVRTMLALVALGKLADTPAFHLDDLTVGQVESAVRLGRSNLTLYPELIPPLLAIGRHDLAHTIERKIKVYHLSRLRRRLRQNTERPLARFLGKIR